MKVVQVAGGSAASERVYIGPSRELRVDDSNHDLLIHDGTTAGGHRLINRDNGDARWHPKSVELLGLDFLPEQRGLLIRRGPADYRIRAITVNGDNLTIVESDGYDADPYISLAPTITSPHEFTNDILIQGVLQVNGGVNGDVSGDTFGTHTGPVIGDVLGDVVGDLTGNAAGNHTGNFAGNVDVTGKTLTLDDNEIGLSKINGLDEHIRSLGVPTGVILMWSGLIADIPAGWALCDGINGPDLRDRFVYGAGGTYPEGDIGGAENHQHHIDIIGTGAHDHLISVDGHVLTTAEIPAHNHAITTTGSSAGSTLPLIGAASVSGAAPVTQNTGGGTAHTHGLTVSADGSHDHSEDTDVVSHLPPYMALAYIIKLP